MQTFLANYNSFPDSLQWKYCREGVVEEKDGFLCVTDEAGNVNEAQVLFEYGKNHEGYWTSHHFMQQIENAVKNKRYTTAHTNYTLQNLCTIVPKGLN